MDEILVLAQQHDDIIDSCVFILNKLDEVEPSQDPKTFCDKLLTLSERVKEHLETEDELVYPFLLGHTNTLVKGKAELLRTEIGDLAERFTQYTDNWTCPEDISTRPGEFKKETHTMINALLHRIYKEDNDLYPLVSQIKKE